MREKWEKVREGRTQNFDASQISVDDGADAVQADVGSRDFLFGVHRFPGNRKMNGEFQSIELDQLGVRQAHRTGVWQSAFRELVNSPRAMLTADPELVIAAISEFH